MNILIIFINYLKCIDSSVSFCINNYIIKIPVLKQQFQTFSNLPNGQNYSILRFQR